MKYLYCFLCTLLLSGHLTVNATHSVHSIKDVENVQNISKYFHYYENKNNQQNIDYVKNKLPFRHWRKITEEVPNFGYSSSTFWFKATLTGSPQCHNKIIRINYPLLDEIEVFVFSNNRLFTHYQAGDSLKFDKRLIKSSKFLFPISCNFNQAEVYIRVKSESSLNIPIMIESERAFWEKEQHEILSQGIYYGILLVLAIHSLFLWFSIREKSSLYYIFYVASYAFVQAGIHGYGFQYIWPEATYWNSISVSVMVSLSILFGSLFAREFLSLDVHFKYLSRIIQGVGIAGGVNAMLSFFIPYVIVIHIAITLTLVGVIAISYSGVRVWLLKKIYSAGYFTIAWTTFLFGSLMLSLVKLGLLPSNFFTENSAQIGSALEIILLSIAISDRIRRLRESQKETDKIIRSTLEKNNEELKAAAQMKDEFLSSLSHELRTPMMAITGGLELMKFKENNDPDLDKLEISAIQMNTHIDKILLYSEIHNGHLRRQHNTIEIESFLKKIADQTKSRCNEKQLHFSYLKPTNLPSAILSDERLLYSLMVNLLDNAIKYTLYGEVCFQVKMEFRFDETILHVVIKDTGPGFDNEQLDVNIKPFHTNSQNTALHGLGLGLALCQHIVSFLDGKMIVNSVKNQGTQIDITLPINPDESHVPIHVEKDEKSIIGKSCLIVEDDRINQVILSRFLTQLKVRFKIANNGQEAIEILKTESFDIILMDCHMPVMNGFDATIQIRHRLQMNCPPILAVTADVSSATAEKCRTTGFTSVVYKPFTYNALIEQLSKALLT